VFVLMRVKICGLCTAADAGLAAGSGADYAGVILSPVGPRRQTVGSAAPVYEAATGLKRVGVFVDAEPAEVEAAARELALDVVQLHGSEDPSGVEWLRGRGPWRIWKAIRLRSPAGFAEALRVWPDRVDGLLFDGWSDRGAGGVGEAFDWVSVAPLRAHWPAGLELIVAGGLRPDNVGLVIRTLAPDTVDVSSGVESRPCHKSADLVRAFVEAARAAEEETVARNGSR
jgi:phosphoribosylanthranilate isomerase